MEEAKTFHFKKSLRFFKMLELRTIVSYGVAVTERVQRRLRDGDNSPFDLADGCVGLLSL